ncbi:methyltransferase domain-containing protein [Auraticoccus sp. F435]|uniref:Methyltransferase domain-containing protein n=1 Tax=Auraticoccus cholistanensis TaxID=2656650 RepID=A0A6A9UTL7_9ACTN|nr:methyltransferase domain-containing protein [Auraticoccus cholistanensis]
MSPDRRPGWALDEVGSAGRENLDPDHVARYDAIEDAAAEEVAWLRAAGVLPCDVVVDLGAGTGQFTLAVAGTARRVVAVDVSTPMLARLRTKLVSDGVEGVETVQAGFLSYRHTGAPADLVYSRYALHHLPDAWKAIALTRARALLRPGGTLRLWDLVLDFPAQEAEQRFEAWCASAGDAGTGGWSRADFEEHLREEHSTFSWLLEPMLERAGFAVRDRAVSEDRMFVRYLLTAV